MLFLYNQSFVVNCLNFLRYMSGSVQPTVEEIQQETAKFHAINDARSKEDEYVHDVYNEIAQHFSKTRYKPWPIVEEFLTQMEPHSIGVDVGCGNGKYVNINPKLFIIGSDFSTGLINQAKILHKDEISNDLIVADGLNLPHGDSKFDFAISIAVIHHFSSKERRVNAIVEILRTLKKGGKALIYCWALEQENSRRGYHEGMDPDVLVPWVLPVQQPKKQKKKKSRSNQNEETDEQKNSDNVAEPAESEPTPKPETKMRFYHLYKKGELSADCEAAGGCLVRDGYERDNWWSIVEKV